MDVTDIVRKYRSGNKHALARAITIIENRLSGYQTILSSIWDLVSPVQVIGITGPPGSGKSTLVNQIIGKFRESDLSVAILATDPTSPYSGGAILGDRIRMLDYTDDSEVYVRSMASRGRLGGVSSATFDTIALLRNAGFDKIIVETVGAGQSEIDIVRHVDTTLVISVPGLGDDIQIIKAGIMEIADIFVANKADQGGTKQLAIQIKNLLNLVPRSDVWRPPILEVSALKGTNIAKLVNAISDHWNYLQVDSKLQTHRREQLRFNLIQKIQEFSIQHLESTNADPINKAIDNLVDGDWSPQQAIKYLVKHLSISDSAN